MMNVIEHGPYHTTEDNADPFTCNENSLRVVTKRMSDLQKVISPTSPNCARPPKSPLRPRPQSTYRPTSPSILSQRRPSVPIILESPIISVNSRGRSNSISSTDSSLFSSNPSTPKTPITPIYPTPSDKDICPPPRRRRPMESKSAILSPTTDNNRFLLNNTRKSASATTSNSKHQSIEEEAIGRIIIQDENSNAVSQYQLGNCIGKGQFGSVYRALELSTGEVVAIKRIKLEDENLFPEIMKEVNILKTLSHSNIVKYIGFIPSDQYVYLVLEYAENGSLMSTLKAFGAFPEKLVASFCIKILKGLNYLHINQVVHCDLKAANILTTKSGDVKLTDFGVSLNLKIKGVDTDTVSGTPNWMAPEVIELKGATTKSDIWSLGCTLIELVTGKPPYNDMLPMSAMFRIVEDDYPPLPSNISEPMHDFLLKCFQKNPDNRASSAELLQHPWILKNQKPAQPKKRDVKSLGPSNTSDLHHLLKENQSKKSVGTTKSLGKCYPAIGDRHCFMETSFGKVVECKVCGEIIEENSLFCEICSLVCHKECKKSAFCCPPKVNDQQPSYDWVFSATLCNRSNQERKPVARGHIPHEFGTKQGVKSSSVRERSLPLSIRNHPQAECIRKYALALGLTTQEQMALCDNPALLMHTMAMEKSVNQDETFIDRFMKKRKEDSIKKGVEEQCIIS